MKGVAQELCTGSFIDAEKIVVGFRVACSVQYARCKLRRKATGIYSPSKSRKLGRFSMTSSSSGQWQ